MGISICKNKSLKLNENLKLDHNSDHFVIEFLLLFSLSIIGQLVLLIDNLSSLYIVMKYCQMPIVISWSSS